MGGALFRSTQQGFQKSAGLLLGLATTWPPVLGAADLALAAIQSLFGSTCLYVHIYNIHKYVHIMYVFIYTHMYIYTWIYIGACMYMPCLYVLPVRLLILNTPLRLCWGSVQSAVFDLMRALSTKDQICDLVGPFVYRSI